MHEPTDDGGPAFPIDAWNSDASEYLRDGGMSLRDYFAGKELAKVDCVSVCGQPAEYERLADHCYRMADAMLKARSAA